MSNFQIYYVGDETEVSHHAEPLRKHVNVQIVSPYEVGTLAAPGDVAIFFSEHFDRFRNAVFELKRQGVATIYALDGILEWRNAWENRIDEPACPWTMRPILSDRAACIGNLQKRILDSWGNEHKTHVVGLPRLDELIDQNQRISQPTVEQDKIRVLITTAKFPGFTESQMENARRAMQDLKEWFTNNPVLNDKAIEVTWRLTKQLAEQIGVKNSLTNVTGQELHQQIKGSNIVLTTPSTVQLESMILGRPVAIVDYNNCPHYVDAAWKITSRDHIASVFTSMVVPSQEKLSYQKWLLHENLQLQDSAVDRMLQLIADVQKVAGNENQSVPKIDSDAIDSADMSHRCDESVQQTSNRVLHHDRQYPQHAAFTETNLLELQSQLAHSRREIDLRQARIDQLESELAEAHHIFEQIENHPIAGPVVKIRRGFQSLISSFTGKKKPTEPAQPSN
jgi:hypothetical protein